MPPHKCNQEEVILELHQNVSDIKERLGTGDTTFALMAKDIKDVLSQTTKTNGSVKSLLMWRAWILGCAAGIGVINVPIVVYIVMKVTGD